MFERISNILVNSRPFGPLPLGNPYLAAIKRWLFQQIIKPTILSIVILLFFCEFKSRADVILGALQTSSGQSSKMYIGSTKSIAQSFYYSNNFTLTGLNLNLFSTDKRQTGFFDVILYTGGLTGTQKSLNGDNWENLLIGNSSNVLSIQFENIELLKDTTYWIAVTSNRSSPTFNWSTFNNKFGNGTAYTDIATYDSNTSTWETRPGSSTNAMGMEILGTVASVPEPGTLILTGFALALGAFCVWCKRHRIYAAGTTPTVC